MRTVCLLVVVASWYLSALGPALACKYTVRDVAFVDFNDQPYQFLVYLDQTTTEDQIALLRNTAEVSLADSNVQLHVQKPAESESESGQRKSKAPGTTAQLTAELVAPDGRVWPISLPTLSDNSTESLRESLASVVHSPLRASIMQKLIDAHSVVLIVESNLPAENERAKSMVADAVARVEASLPDLPKPIDIPPSVIVVSTEQARNESILLWSLGVDLARSHGTQIAMLFGRGRALGPVMDVAGLEDRDLLRVLAVVGLDCECELDRSWMQAPMIPHRWTSEDEAVAAKALDFDPGHPLVRVEISRILSRGPNTRQRDAKSRNATAGADLGEIDALLPGLQIIELDFETDEIEPDEFAPVAEPPSEAPAATNAAEAASSESAEDSLVEAEKNISTTTFVSTMLISLACLGIVGGALVILLGKRGGA